METKDLQREIADAYRLAERGQIILNQNEELVKLRQENTELKALIDTLETKAATTEE